MKYPESREKAWVYCTLERRLLLLSTRTAAKNSSRFVELFDQSAAKFCDNVSNGTGAYIHIEKVLKS